jgi:hypothetical protein
MFRVFQQVGHVNVREPAGDPTEQGDKGLCLIQEHPDISLRATTVDRSTQGILSPVSVSKLQVRAGQKGEPFYAVSNWLRAVRRSGEAPNGTVWSPGAEVEASHHLGGAVFRRDGLQRQDGTLQVPYS